MMIRSAVFCLAVLFSAAAHGQIDAARAKFQEYGQAQQAQAEAMAQGNPEVVQQRMAEAAAVRAEARKLYETDRAWAAGESSDVLNYASVLNDAGDHDLAAEALESGISSAPEDARLWVALGSSRLQMGPAGQKPALAALKQALKLQPEKPQEAEAHYTLGKLYHQLGLSDFATEEYQAALAALPEHVPAQIGLAALRAGAGAVAEASKMLDDLGRKAQPYDAETRVLLRHGLKEFTQKGLTLADTFENHAAFARLLYRAARFPDAIMAAQRAVVLKPDSFETLNFIGTIQYQAGNPGLARETLEQSLKVNPNQPEIAELVKNLPESSTPPPAATAPAPGGQSAPPLLQRPADQ